MAASFARTLLIVSCFLMWAISVPAGAGPIRQAVNDPRVVYARELARGLPIPCRVEVGAKAGAPESFSLRVRKGEAAVTGGGPAGALYGVQELLRIQRESGRIPARLDLREGPSFEVRGNALLLMKEATYNYQLTPQEFPWFYDRPLLTRYLDYLFENRFNAVFLWSGNLFPSIVEMPEYPDSTDLSREQLAQNQEQFRWFTRECAKRNIQVLLHFYQIHIPVPLARSRRIPVTYGKPNEFVSTYMRYVLTRFLSEFDSVGLYVCPGEALATRYQPEWIRDVIFAAAKQSGKHPLIVVRDWTLDPKRFKEVCVGQYDNLYTERKHNVEMLVSPTPDEAHRFWLGVARKHIVNVHENSDVKPFRWGSPRFIHEMVRHWHEVGVNGAEAYGMVSWRFPYSLDKLDSSQTGYWPAGRKLLTMDRDAIWLAALGRYLWKVDRNPRAEDAYWDRWLGQRFGISAGRLLRRWYDTTGPVLPGFQNLTSVLNMNFYPTAVGKEQSLDAILSARVALGSKEKATGNYHSQPVDEVFYDRYVRTYHPHQLRDRYSMCVSEYADRLVSGKPIADAMTPDRISALLVRMAEEGASLAKQAAESATSNREEAQRFVTDSQALALVARAWDCKVRAAIAKRIWQRTGRAEEGQKCISALRESVAVYSNLVELTDRTYINATDMLLSLNWHNGLKAFEADLAANEKQIAAGSTPLRALTDSERKAMLDGYFERLTGPKPFAFATREEWMARRDHLRQAVRKWLALDPLPERIPLDVRWGGQLDRGDYRIRRVYYRAWPGFYASGWLYEPTAPGKHPVVLNPHGHWNNGATEPVVQQRLIALAKLGYVALAVDAVHLDPNPFSVTPSHARALALGISDATIQVWNLMRALDLLETLPEADMTRVGCTGESGGGLQTLYLMCMDDRIQVAIPAVYVCNVRGFMEPAAEVHCMCNYVPGVLRETDLPELAATFVPKPALYLNVTRDWTAKVPTREFPQIQAVYRLMGAEDKAACKQWDNDHTYDRPMREAAYAWLNHHLLGREGAVTEPEVKEEAQETLHSLDRAPGFARPWSQLSELLAPQLAALAAEADSAALRTELLRLLGDVPVKGSLAAPAAAIECNGLPALRLRVRSESGIEVPAILLRPAGIARPRVAIVLAPGGKAEVLGARLPLVKALVAAGVAVLAPDVRLTGELHRDWARYTVFWGRPEAGMALTDLRACLDVLAARSDLDGQSVSLIGLGESSATAVIAGALEPRFGRVIIERLGPSYAEGRTSPLIPGIRRIADLPQVSALLPLDQLVVCDTESGIVSAATGK